MATDNEIQKELEEIGPALSRLPRINPYTAPTGYFEQFPSTVLASVKQAKVVSIDPQRKAWRLAAAAAISGTIILGGWLFMEKRTPVPTLAPAYDASVQKDMKEVSDTEIAAYVDGNDFAPAEDLSSDQIKDEDVPLVLANASDQDLQQYLDQENSSVNLN